jgi:hypothetical protein
MKLLFWLVSLMVFCCVRLCLAATSPLPYNWVRCLRPPKSAFHREDPIEWDLFLDKEQIKLLPVTKREAFVKRDFISIMSDTPEDGTDYENGRLVKKVKDGWLVGFNKGEFGGSLWWVSQDQQEKRKLFQDIIVGFLDFPQGTIVLTGLDWSFHGRVLWVSREAQTGYHVKVLAELGGEPHQFFKESLNSILVITDIGPMSPYNKRNLFGNGNLIRITLDGKSQRFPRPSIDFLNEAKSMIRTSSGDVYVGTGRHIVRLLPTKHGYKEQWFTIRIPGNRPKKPSYKASLSRRRFNGTTLGDSRRSVPNHRTRGRALARRSAGRNGESNAWVQRERSAKAS